MNQEEKAWYKELWEDFMKQEINHEDYGYDSLYYEFFIWQRGTRIEDICNWFSEKTDGAYPLPDYHFENSNQTDDETGCDDDEVECWDCGRINCCCDCDHIVIDEDGCCENCDSNVREDCYHHQIAGGECLYCRMPEAEALANRATRRALCRQHMREAYEENGLTLCLICEQE
jgi:hypothetical protein